MSSSTKKKQRLDLWLVENSWFDSRQRAQRAVMAGWIRVDGRVAVKPSCWVLATTLVEWHKKPQDRYASRGAHKLLKALEVFEIDPKGQTVIDVGASTGGFTDVWLRGGAGEVWAVDVGYGQLAQTLRDDARVRVLERTNARYLESEDVEGRSFSLFSVDVSFISLGLIFPALFKVCAPRSRGVTLIKPQFEAGRSKVGPKGVVREASVHREVLQEVLVKAHQAGWRCLSLSFSPIKGPKGNVEFLGFWERFDSLEESAFECSGEGELLDRVVQEAHRELLGGES